MHANEGARTHLLDLLATLCDAPYTRQPEPRRALPLFQMTILHAHAGLAVRTCTALNAFHRDAKSVTTAVPWIHGELS